MRFTTAVALAVAASATSSHAVPLQARRASKALENASSAAGIADGLSGVAANAYEYVAFIFHALLFFTQMIRSFRASQYRRDVEELEIRAFPGSHSSGGSRGSSAPHAGPKGSHHRRDVEELEARAFPGSYSSGGSRGSSAPHAGPKGSHHRREVDELEARAFPGSHSSGGSRGSSAPHAGPKGSHHRREYDELEARALWLD